MLLALLLFAQESVGELQDSVLTVDIQLLNFLAGFIVPLLVGLLTKLHAPSGLKAILNLGLSAVAGALATAIGADGNIELAQWITGIGMTWLTSIVSYYGLLKPTGVAPGVQHATRGFGIGSAQRSAD